jgi:hypothetical protein
VQLPGDEAQAAADTGQGPAQHTSGRGAGRTVIRIKLAKPSVHRVPATTGTPPLPSTPLTPPSKEPALGSGPAVGRTAADPGNTGGTKQAVLPQLTSPAHPPSEAERSREQGAAVLPDAVAPAELPSEEPGPAHTPGPAVPAVPVSAERPQGRPTHLQQVTSAAAEPAMQTVAATHRSLARVPALVGPAAGVQQVAAELGGRHAPTEQPALPLSVGGRGGVMNHVNGVACSAEGDLHGRPGVLTLMEGGQGSVPPPVVLPPDEGVLPPPGAECQLPGDLVEGYGIKDTRVLTSSEPPSS